MSPSAILGYDSTTADPEWTQPVSALKTNFAPREANGPLCWKGEDLLEQEYLVSLDKVDIEELEHVGRGYQSTGAPLNHISPESFVLPRVGPKLREAKNRLYHGIGFFVLRGLDPGRYDNHLNTIIYAGLASYIGRERGIQYDNGPVLTHVVDLSAEEDMQKNTGRYVGQANRNVSLPFHTDDGHILALYSLHSACKGGRSRLSSAWTIYNNLLRDRPDVIDTLKQSWEWDSFRTNDSGFRRPLLFHHKGKVILNFARRYFLGSPGSPRNPMLAPLSATQIEALDALETEATRTALTFDFKTGDIQFVNNLAVLHGRESFINSDLTGCRRHILRMFLRDNEMAWPVPQPLQPVMTRLYDHSPCDEDFPWSLAPLPYVMTP